MVFYRKYRPQTIEELDSTDVRDTLYSVFTAKSVPHAFLFTGPKGLGKTSAARIIAKIINCEKNKKDVKDKKLITNESVEPCNKCIQCTSVTSGTNIDILEIDGASNRGIDEIRDLRDKIRLSPALASKKVYIIDEVHMLTTEAFNALLKTLEEPPSHAIFILCTTEPHKVPETISSRCFQISFMRATNEELLRSFQRIAKNEKIAIDKDALSLIANMSDGSFRDGVKILEQIRSLVKDEKITKELVEKKYKSSNINQYVLQMLENLANKDLKKSLVLISEVTKQGIDLKYLTESLAEKIHKILLVKVGVLEKEEKLPIDFSMEEIKKLAMLLEKTAYDLKYTVLPQLPLELLIMEWCEEPKEKVTKDLNIPIENSKAKPILLTSKQSINTNTDNDIWQRLIDKVKTHNHSIAGVLRGGSLKSWEDGKVIIETNFKFHKEKLDEAKEILEEACEEISGKKANVSILLKDK
ncbi:MAG: DNA polymerase III subunit gamma/tau [Candidatus Levyibacteriota bacterium]